VRSWRVPPLVYLELNVVGGDGGLPFGDAPERVQPKSEPPTVRPVLQLADAAVPATLTGSKQFEF
jgi:hypothetical protein